MSISRNQTGTPAALESVTAAETQVAMDQQGRREDRVVYVRGVGTITGGTIKIEEATELTYAGLWSLLDTITASDLSGGGTDGVETAKHYIGCKFRAFRVRVSSAILGGGSVSLVMD